MGATDRLCQPMFSHVARCDKKMGRWRALMAPSAAKLLPAVARRFSARPLHHGGEEGREGKSKGRAEGYRDQRLAGPLSPGMPDEVVKSIPTLQPGGP